MFRIEIFNSSATAPTMQRLGIALAAMESLRNGFGFALAATASLRQRLGGGGEDERRLYSHFQTS